MEVSALLFVSCRVLFLLLSRSPVLFLFFFPSRSLFPIFSLSKVFSVRYESISDTAGFDWEQVETSTVFSFHSSQSFGD